MSTIPGTRKPDREQRCFEFHVCINSGNCCFKASRIWLSAIPGRPLAGRSKGSRSPFNLACPERVEGFKPFNRVAPFKTFKKTRVQTFHCYAQFKSFQSSADSKNDEQYALRERRNLKHRWLLASTMARRPVITSELAVRFDSFVEAFAGSVPSVLGWLWDDHRSIALLPCEKFLPAGWRCQPG
jgi:hypothetical protein